ncbi:MAG: response regulator [Vicinamibacterales bacterium]
MNAIRLLIVDDDEVDRRALARAIARAGIAAEVSESDSARDGLARMARGECDCVLLDYRLPDLDGLEVLAEAQRLGLTVPIIALTGQGDERLAVKLMKAGAADYLAKQDLTPDRLERCVRHALAVADLTRLKARLLEREHRARRDAEAENAAKDQFLATLSHELRTPLNVILGWSRLLTGGALDDGGRARAYDAIERNASTLARHIDDLLDISRIVTGHLSLAPSPTEIAPAVIAALESLRPGAQAKSIELGFAEIGEPRLVTVDPNRLNQIVMNLVSNAIKFTPDGGRVDVRVRFAGDGVELEVQDTGAGIPASFLPNLFSRFRQADPSASRRHGGLGLGLSIVQQLVQLHGGTVTAESEGEGRGATFRVSLPLGHDAAVTTPEPAPPSGKRLEGLRVLMVDDEPDARELVTILLQLDGAEVVTAPSAEGARVALAREHFDVMVSDISMPGEDGYSLLTGIRAAEAARGLARLPAVALTALARQADRERATEVGFDRYLAKPVRAEVLVGVVAALAGASPLRAVRRQAGSR